MSTERLHVIIRLPWKRPEGFVEPVQSDEFSEEPFSFLRQRHRRETTDAEELEKPDVLLQEPVQRAGAPLRKLNSEDGKRPSGKWDGDSRGHDVGVGEGRGSTTRDGDMTESRRMSRNRTGFHDKGRSSGSAEITSPTSNHHTSPQSPRSGLGSSMILSSETKPRDIPRSELPRRAPSLLLEHDPGGNAQGNAAAERHRGQSSAKADEYESSDRRHGTSLSTSDGTVSSPSSTSSFHSAFSTTTETEKNKSVDLRSSRHRERDMRDVRLPTTRIRNASTILPPLDIETVDEPFPRAAVVALRGFVPGRRLVNSSDEEDEDEKSQQEEEEEEDEEEEDNDGRYDTESLLSGSGIHGIHSETTHDQDFQAHDTRTRSRRDLQSALSRRLSQLATMDEPAFLPPPNGSESTTVERADPIRLHGSPGTSKPRSSRIPSHLLPVPSSAFEDSSGTTVRTPISTRPLQNISPPPSAASSSPPSSSSPPFRHRHRRKSNSDTAAITASENLSPSESPPVTGSSTEDTDEEISDSSVTQSAMEEAYLSGLGRASKTSSVSNA